jgi:SAM-dependent methyltransferase
VLITQTYEQLNRQLYVAEPEYGTSGKTWAKYVRNLCQNPRSILDYGCGRRTLEQALGFPIQNYDPCIKGFEDPPEPADMVACTDVLEHIEPECLDAVLDDLKRVTRKDGFFVIATRKAAKVLADGRNAHLIVQPAEWWLPKLQERFRVTGFSTLDIGLLIVVVKAK